MKVSGEAGWKRSRRQIMNQRRLRENEWIRDLVREVVVRPEALAAPFRSARFGVVPAVRDSRAFFVKMKRAY